MPTPRTARKPRAINDGEQEIRKTDGRTREGRAARAVQAEPQAALTQRTRAQPREAVRETTRRGAVVAQGRGGETLSRTRTSVNDPFHIPEELKEPGWDMQWIAISVAGSTEVVSDQNLMMAENGWRPVPATRFPGRYMPKGHTGAIIRGGQGLYERPMTLTEEARAEDYAKAVGQMRDRDEALTGRKANVRGNIGDGLELQSNTNYRGRKTRLSIDTAYDIPAPQHQLAEPGE